MKILICDDHALFREGLELVIAQLDPEAALVGVGDAESALEEVAQADFDLVLLDLRLPGMDGFAALSRLRSEFPAVPVVLLSASERREDVRAALDGGASGFIPKSTRGAVLLSALRLVLSGGIYVPPLVMEGDAPASAAEAPPEGAARLTERQVEVLRLLARGLTNKDISRVLGIAEGTVKTHVLRIYEGLGVSNRTEAAMQMRALGLDD